jgi:hypothetical protein
VPPHEWQGCIEVPAGRVCAAEPCWKTTGQHVGDPGGSRCDFTFRTLQSPPHGDLPTEATIFELEARPGDTLTLRLNDRCVSMTLAEAMAGSRIVAFTDEAEALIRRTFGVDPDSLPRRDRVYFFSYKAKIHRAIPEAGFAAVLDHTDADPPPGENCYRVRVLQRNGQAAWSSPVWVRSG